MDQIVFRMYSWEDWAIYDRAHAMIRILMDSDTAFVPEFYNSNGRKKYPLSSESLEQATSAWLNKDEQFIRFYGKRKFHANIRIYWNTISYNILSGEIDDTYFLSESAIESFINMMKALCNKGAVAYGYACHNWDLVRQTLRADRRYGGSLPTICLPGIFWFNCFGVEYVNFFGKDEIDSIDKEYISPSDQSGIFIRTCNSPFDWKSADVQQLEDTLKSHLNHHTFYIPDLKDESYYQTPATLRNRGEIIIVDWIGSVITNTEEYIAEAESLATNLVLANSKLSYSMHDLLLIDKLIRSSRKKYGDPEDSEDGRQLLRQIAAYYGETLKRTFQGKWATIANPGCLPHPAIQFQKPGSDVVEDELVMLEVYKLWVDPGPGESLARRWEGL